MLVFFVNRCGDEKSNNESMEGSRWNEVDGKKIIKEKGQNKKMNFPGLSIGGIADYLNR